ncbi:hypothetical protein ACSQ67_016123 [Phaseolus vulgaris]
MSVSKESLVCVFIQIPYEPNNNAVEEDHLIISSGSSLFLLYHSPIMVEPKCNERLRNKAKGYKFQKDIYEPAQNGDKIKGENENKKGKCFSSLFPFKCINF